MESITNIMNTIWYVFLLGVLILGLIQLVRIVRS